MAAHNVTRPSRRQSWLVSGRRFQAVLCNIRSAHNVGSIFRTADGAGFEKIWLCGYTPIPETRGRKRGSDKVAKTSLGAEKTVPWEYCPTLPALIRQLKKEGFIVAALEQAAKGKNLFGFKTKKPVALIMGNEVKGISPATLRLTDVVLEIPMNGQKESLNVSVAFGVAAYHLAFPV